MNVLKNYKFLKGNIINYVGDIIHVGGCFPGAIF